MEIINKTGGAYVLRFEKGEAYPDVFIRFLKSKKIRGGFFTGLGAGVDPEVSFYDLKKRKYFSRRFRGDFEVLNLAGNVAKKGKDLILHQHIAFSGRDCRAIGGHLNQMIIGGTLEIFLTDLPKLKRGTDVKTGLNLLEG